MTRILLATLEFYRRWLSPALHTLSPGGAAFCPRVPNTPPSRLPTTDLCAA